MHKHMLLKPHSVNANQLECGRLHGREITKSYYFNGESGFRNRECAAVMFTFSLSRRRTQM